MWAFIRAPRSLALGVTCTLCVVGIVAASAHAAVVGHEALVEKTGTGDYLNVDVGDRYAVMQKQTSSADIVAYDLRAGSPVEMPVAVSAADEFAPAVAAGRVAYLRERPSGTNELMLDTIPSTGPGGSIISNFDYADPAMWGDICAYALDSDADGRYGVYWWDVTTSKHNVVYEPTPGPYSTRRPSVWRNIVAYEWIVTSGPTSNVFYEPLDGGWSVTPNPTWPQGDRMSPDVWGEWIVWEDHTSADYDVVAHNILTRKDTIIGHDGAFDGNASVYDDRVVYTSLATDFSSAHVYVYDLMSGEEHELWNAPNAWILGQTSAYGQHVGWWDFIVDADAHVARLDVTLEVEQLEGPTRYDTAVEISKALSPGTCENVIMATGQNFPDALGGSALAGAVDCPILLTRPGELPAVVAQELGRLMPKTVYILGGAGAVEDAVQDAIEGILPGVTIKRLEGADRYGTARAVAQEAKWHPRQEFRGKAFVATGANFPDALAASPVAAALQMPIYLAEPSGMSSANISHMKDLDITEVYIIGGADVVSELTEERLTDAFGTDHVHRLAGATRYDTAAEIAEWAVEEMPFIEYCGVTLATGQNFPDALAGGALAGSRGTVMLLTHAGYLTPSTQHVLATECNDAPWVTFFGGAGAIEPEVIESVKDVVD